MAKLQYGQTFGQTHPNIIESANNGWWDSNVCTCFHIHPVLSGCQKALPTLDVPKVNV